MSLKQSTEVLLLNFLPLPENLQKEVIDFASFLLLKQEPDNFQKNIQEVDLSEAQKELLIKRYEAMKANPERKISWQAAREKLFTKYGIQPNS
jgi:hypothetical protein